LKVQAGNKRGALNTKVFNETEKNRGGKHRAARSQGLGKEKGLACKGRRKYPKGGETTRRKEKPSQGNLYKDSE